MFKNKYIYIYTFIYILETKQSSLQAPTPIEQRTVNHPHISIPHISTRASASVSGKVPSQTDPKPTTKTRDSDRGDRSSGGLTLARPKGSLFGDLVRVWYSSNSSMVDVALGSDMLGFALLYIYMVFIVYIYIYTIYNINWSTHGLPHKHVPNGSFAKWSRNLGDGSAAGRSSETLVF